MKAAFVLFDRMTSLDFIGFYDSVTRLKSMKIMEDFGWRFIRYRRGPVPGRKIGGR
jgi:cyclohexyl-isocyanide hydratase